MTAVQRGKVAHGQRDSSSRKGVWVKGTKRVSVASPLCCYARESSCLLVESLVLLYVHELSLSSMHACIHVPARKKPTGAGIICQAGTLRITASTLRSVLWWKLSAATTNNEG